MKVGMKKIVLILCAALLCSFASAAGKSSKKKAEPVYDMESANVMDANWEKYFDTGDEQYLDNIIAYVDTEDLLMTEINKKAGKLIKDEKFVQAMKNLGAEVSGKKFVIGFALEPMVGFLVQDENFAQDIRYIYSYFPQELFIRGVMKNTAFWSLTSNAEQHQEINIALQKRIPYMDEKLQNTFSMSMTFEDWIGLVKSDTGAAEFSNTKIQIIPVLVNDLDKTINDWNTLKPEEMPKITSTSEVNIKKGNDIIAPFITFFVKGKCDFPLYYDCELIDPKGEKSDFNATKLNFASQEPSNKNYIYSVQQNCGWKFDNTDPVGKYLVKITVYSEKQVIAIFEMTFSLKK